MVIELELTNNELNILSNNRLKELVLENLLSLRYGF